VCDTPGQVWEHAQCQDGLDNDGDGALDFDGGLSFLGSALAPPDPQCEARPWRIIERPSLVCGLGHELVLVLVGWASLRRRRIGGAVA
jgi:hypothetical protein